MILLRQNSLRHPPAFFISAELGVSSNYQQSLQTFNFLARITRHIYTGGGEFLLIVTARSTINTSKLLHELHTKKVPWIWPRGGEEFTGMG